MTALKKYYEFFFFEFLEHERQQSMIFAVLSAYNKKKNEIFFSLKGSIVSTDCYAFVDVICYYFFYQKNVNVDNSMHIDLIGALWMGQNDKLYIFTDFFSSSFRVSINWKNLSNIFVVFFFLITDQCTSMTWIDLSIQKIAVFFH